MICDDESAVVWQIRLMICDDEGGRFADDVGRELEENLGMIEEVTQYVKIVNSYAILSLRFLSRLKRIKGLALHNKKYADGQTHIVFELILGFYFK